MNRRQKALIMFLGTTGCRISEALDLKWSEVNRGKDKSVVFFDTKNGEDREVWVDDDVFALIDDLPKGHDYVFFIS